MKKIFIASFDLEVGGVERSLISMLNNFDYKNYNIDLMLYNHSGEFMQYLNNNVNLLSENKKYATIRKSIISVFKEGFINLGSARIIAKYKGKRNEYSNIENVKQMQYMWKYSIKLLPKIQKEYDVAISYLWPHYCVSENVNAKIKIAWIHTDYSNIEIDVKEDLRVWGNFNYIIAVSESCKISFLKKYPELKSKVLIVENIISEKFIKKMANEKIEKMNEKDEFKLLTVARYSYAKGIDNAVKALRKIHDDGYTNIKWYVIGYGGDEELIKELIKENNLENSFILLGKKINPYPYMKACDLYVQPSRYEGKAVTVQEAQILGKAVLITNYETARSQINHKEDGYITELSIEGIAEGIKKLYRDKKIRGTLENNSLSKKNINSEEMKRLYDLF